MYPIFDNIHAHSACVQKARKCVSNQKSFNSFILAQICKIDFDSLKNLIIRKTKICFGSFFLNAVRFFVYFSIFSDPSDQDA